MAYKQEDIKVNLSGLTKEKIILEIENIIRNKITNTSYSVISLEIDVKNTRMQCRGTKGWKIGEIQ